MSLLFNFDREESEYQERTKNMPSSFIIEELRSIVGMFDNLKDRDEKISELYKLTRRVQTENLKLKNVLQYLVDLEKNTEKYGDTEIYKSLKKTMVAKADMIFKEMEDNQGE